ncbi:diacylglycerol kinase family protein [Gemmata sp. JC673]|uniref:Diacylglycerol kinase family protein n=1 Tax=Gemmata algarum TaxID=2975278 RepID=A0ABU5ETS0_9BACT|nr:diacylglycerol kinase family protein [Gemmata algarum]MDY3558560.1 diacylglycerol kinase family protein [Gemmata algarum]
MNFRKLVRSLTIGCAGLIDVIRSEQNMRIHCVVAAGVTVAGLVFALAAWEWVAVVLCIGLVLSAECMNTALERLADRVTQERDPLIKQAKDCGAAAVLVVALTAVVVGGAVFVPKIGAAVGW